MDKYDEYTDEELIELLHSMQNEPAKYSNPIADEDAIMEHLMKKYKPLVLKKTNALFLIGGETDDLIQEGMIGLFKAVRDFCPGKNASFFHFAGICITRQLCSALEASNRQKHIPLNTALSLSQEDEEGNCLEDLVAEGIEDDPESLFIQQEVYKEFKKKFYSNLSKMEKNVLQLYLEGNSYTQIAEQMGKTPKSIDNAIQRIRQKIGTLQV